MPKVVTSGRAQLQIRCSARPPKGRHLWVRVPPSLKAIMSMEPKDLLDRLAANEDNLVERKPEGANRSELRRTLVAFANSTPEGQVALLFLGVHDEGRIIGVKNTDALQKTVGDVCNADCYPPIDFFARALEVGGKVILAIGVSYSKRKPHFAGPAFVRRGSESVAASPELYEELIFSRNDKCRQILGWRGQVISVLSIQHKLGVPKRISDQGYREGSECRVLDCTAHVVQLEVVASRVRVSEPLESVTIMRDEEKWRPMLVVRGI